MQIVIVGATSAIAQATIRLWAGAGHSLILFGRNASELERIAADARVRGAVEVIVHAAEITSRSYIESAVPQLPKIDQALVAHGSYTRTDRASTDTAHLVEELNVNFTSAALWTQLLANKMADAGGGTVAVISSVAGDRGRYANHVYGAAKAGLTAFCDGLRARMHERNVNVITVKPGPIDTPMTAHIEKKGLLWGTSEQVAADMLRAIAKRKEVVYSPWFWWAIMRIVRAIPERVAKKLKW
jgi:decaprenylphospho-beta-D-erythro-pentofuranosid-2-ulose 2-reductase